MGGGAGIVTTVAWVRSLAETSTCHSCGHKKKKKRKEKKFSRDGNNRETMLVKDSKSRCDITAVVI